MDDCVISPFPCLFSSPGSAGSTTHLIHLPSAARDEGVCLRWSEQTLSNPVSYSGCWAMDNVLIINMAQPIITFEENFDPIDTSSWLFIPGGNIRVIIDVCFMLYTCTCTGKLTFVTGSNILNRYTLHLLFSANVSPKATPLYFKGMNQPIILQRLETSTYILRQNKNTFCLMS